MGTKVPPPPQLLILRDLGHTQVALRLGQGGLCFSAVHKHLLGEEEVLEAGWAGCFTNQLLTSYRASPGCSWTATEVEGGHGSGWLPASKVGVCAHGDRLGEF